MDLKEIAEAYQLVYEKKKLDPVGQEDDDVDNDGDSDSSDEYLKKRRAAIGKAMGKGGDKEEEEEKKSKKDVKEAYGKKKKKKGHDCASKVKHEEYGVGDCIKEMHTLDSAGNVTHYDVMFEHGIEKNVFVGDLSVLVSEMHEHVINTDKNKEVLGNKDLMSAYYSMYEHHEKDDDGNVIPHPITPDENGLIPVKPDGSPAPAMEEVEQLNELSPDTLKSYIKKSQDQVKKRKKGIERALDQKVEKEVLGRTVKKPKGFYDEEIDLSFVDELTEQELDNLVEGVVYDLLDEGIEIDAIEGAFTEYLEEATVTMGSAPDYVSPEEKMTAAVKKKKEEKAKASKEKAEKFKKSVGKVVDRIKSKPTRVSRGLKAKAHSKLADYAGKRKLMPTKAAAAAVKPKKPYMSKKYKQDPQGEVKFRDAKTKYVGDKAKYDKVKDKKQTAGNMKMSMRGSGAKDTRSKLRSAVFKDVKDRIGKKVSSTIKKGRGKVADGITKTTNVLDKIASKVRGEGRELDMFDTVTAYLIDEGLVRDFDHAQRVMTTLDSTLIEEVHAEQLEYLKEYGAPYTVTNADKKGNTPAYQNMMKGMKSKVTGKPMYKKADHMESLEDAYQKIYNKDA